VRNQQPTRLPAAGVRFLTLATDALLLYNVAAACRHDLA
jgi:hypothetical protein